MTANVDMRRGERLAFLRRVKAPRRVRPGQRVRMRVTMQRIRGGNLTKTYRVRIPAASSPACARSSSTASRSPRSTRTLLELLLGVEEGLVPDAPARLNDLIEAIEALGRWDGIELRLAGAESRAFRDEDLVITGRARTRVRIVQR